MSFPRSPARRPHVQRTRMAQRGVVLVITLIAMVVLLVGLAAILRGVDTSSLIVGNLAFRRDLTNRVEQAIVTAKAAVAGGLGTADVNGSHYSATKLANGATGVPTILDNDSSYNTKYGSDTADSSDSSIAMRYVIDRQCKSGTTTFLTSACEYTSTSSDIGGSSQKRQVNGGTRAIYRVSVRVTGPRSSVAYFQTTFAY